MILKFWNGSSYSKVNAIKYWNGTQWVYAKVKYWNGTQWIVENRNSMTTKLPSVLPSAFIGK